MARYTSSLVNSFPSTMSRLVALGLNEKTEPENSSITNNVLLNETNDFLHRKKKKTANFSYKWSTAPKKSISFVKVSCWQMTNICPLPTMLFWHPVCQHVCDCMNAHGVPESIRDNTTHSLSCSRLSPTSAHIQHDCLTKVSEKLKISPRAESILANCHFLLNWLLLFTNLSK